jgi:hypothetical protein
MIMNNSIVLLVFASLLLTTCNKVPKNSAYVGGQIFIELQNQNGQNILIDSITSAIKFNDIQVYYGQDTVPFYQPNLDCPRMLCRSEMNDIPMLSLFMNLGTGEQYPLTYIKWNEMDTDTFLCHMIQSENPNFIECDSVFLNGRLVYPEGHPIYDRYVKITK